MGRKPVKRLSSIDRRDTSEVKEDSRLRLPLQLRTELKTERSRLVTSSI
jgi:hypothetical protein